MKLYKLLALIAFVILSACGNPQNDEVNSLLDVREKALESKDVDLYLSLISSDYEEVRDDKEFGVDELRDYFLKTYPIFHTLQISNKDRTVYLKGDSAEVFQINRVKATINDETSVFMIKEKIVLKKIGDKWLIVKESDSDYFTGYAFGNIE